MSAMKLAPTVAVNVFAEVPQEVRAHAIGQRVALTFGNDLTGVRFMGSRDELWRLVASAGRVLSEVADDDGGPE